MRERRVGSVLVTDERDHLAEIITGRDAVFRILAAGTDATRAKLGEVMTADPATMSSDQTAVDALRLMWDGGFRHMPLVKGETIIGVVSRGDFKGLEQDRHDSEREFWEHLR